MNATRRDDRPDRWKTVIPPAVSKVAPARRAPGSPLPPPPEAPAGEPLLELQDVAPVPSRRRSPLPGRGGAYHATLSIGFLKSQAPKVDDRGFWEALPSAFLQPMKPTGVRWVVGCTVFGGVLFAIVFATRWMSFIGLLATIPLLICFMGMIAATFRACLWGTLAGEDEPVQMKEFDAGNVIDEYLGPGLALLFHLLLTEITLVLWAASAQEGVAGLVGSAGAWVVLALPALYWPVGMALMAARGSLAFWDVPSAVRIIAGAPHKVLAAVAVGLAGYALPAVLLALLVVPFGAGGLLLGPVLFALPLAYGQAVQGAVMGHLFRTEPGILR